VASSNVRKNGYLQNVLSTKSDGIENREMQNLDVDQNKYFKKIVIKIFKEKKEKMFCKYRLIYMDLITQIITNQKNQK